jgi:hypothetical protein
MARQGSFPVLLTSVGSLLIWWGRGRSILYLFSLTLLLGALAVALWGPEWRCVADQPGEACPLSTSSLPGIWLATVVAGGIALTFASGYVDRRRRAASS